MSDTTPLNAVARYYSDRLARFGPTPAGVDWNSAESQRLRFEQLARVLEPADVRFSVLDYGCGYGAFADFLHERGAPADYTGFDIAPAMAAAAAARHAACAHCAFTDRRDSLTPADYTVASGIFNVKLESSEPIWREYVLSTLDDLAGLSRRGFAFNLLTDYADPDKRRPDLFYGDSRALFDRCKQRYSKFVALHHDYPLYEFTIIVRLAVV